MHVVVAGAGWLGSALARELAAAGHRVTAVRRGASAADALRAPGIEPLAVDLAAPDAGGRLPLDVDAIVACQSASGDGTEAYRQAYVEANRALLAAARRAGRPVAYVYTGSTGVFGQRDGSEVDEETPPAPASPASEVLAEAERLVLGAAGPDLRAMVLRLSGLYGPGRTWPLDRVRAGLMALGPGDGAWMNLCHRDDAVASIVAALARGRPGGVYHASDAEPVRRRALISWVAAHLGIDPPRLPEGARAPAMPDRRVRAERTRAELGIALRYPTFREGLAAAVSPGP